jgi:nitroimidazol reductase NimA-like FMN-containing flavoprotein (pyridoxamine 5'-phosphate oxidase superfamily)
MSKEESHALLRSQRLARLGCVAEGEPYVAPITYVFDEERVFSHNFPA